jgi:FixJ family two-component response regulator
VVDDDASVRKALARLIRSAGFNVETFASAKDFLKRETRDGCGCIVLDIQMPGMNGLELQAVLDRAEDSLPIIFISGYGDIPMSVRAMKKGAVDFLPKPFDDHELLGAISVAMSRDKAACRKHRRDEKIRKHVETLTAREREVMALVVTGMLNKQIAAKLGIAEGTVKVHRGRVMTKMGVTSVAELVGLCAK